MSLLEPQLVAEFTVEGIPRPQGSMRAFAHRTTGKIVVTSGSPKLAPWRRAVEDAARAGRLVVWGGPVAVGITFRLPRPKSHLAKAGLRPSAPHHPDGHGTGDLDKLSRAVLDSLVSAGVVADDSVVVRLSAKKVYGRPGASVRVLAETTP